VSTSASFVESQRREIRGVDPFAPEFLNAEWSRCCAQIPAASSREKPEAEMVDCRVVASGVLFPMKSTGLQSTITILER
jgi:hypothetical protein